MTADLLTATLHELLKSSETSALLAKLKEPLEEDKKSTQSDYTWVTDDNVSTASGSCHRRLLWPDGTVYEGSINANQKPDGHGELRASSGDHYIGEWLDGQLHGFGEYTLADGGTYRGQIADNKKEGFGKLVCRNGLTYEGEWHKDKPHGEGRLVHEDVVFCGHWVHGRIEGRGVYESGVWGRYVGDWKADKKDGAGKVVYASGASYDGRWEADAAHGLGRYTWPNGSWYEGSFHRGQLQGRGRFSSADGKECFVGSWFQSKKSGTGQMKFADGAVYSGEWVSDRPHGKGTFINPYGVMFRGMWHEGLFVADDAGGSRGGLPICMVEGSSYQLHEELAEASALIDARVILPAVPPGHELTSQQIPRPRRFDQTLRDYTVEASSTFTSAVQPTARPQPPCFDSGYAYHTRFEIEYWPHNPDASQHADVYAQTNPNDVYLSGGTQQDLYLPGDHYNQAQPDVYPYAATPTAQEMFSAQPQDIYTAATPTVHEHVFVENVKPRKTNFDQVIRPPSRPATPIDTCRVDLVNLSRKTTGTINPACSRLTTGPDVAQEGSWRGEPPHSMSTTDTVIIRNVPVPVEVAVTTELKFPKIRAHRTQVPFPVYAPRIREVPIPVESLTAEGVQLCEDIAEQISMLQAASREELYLTGCQVDNLAQDISNYNPAYLAPKKQISLSDFVI